MKLKMTQHNGAIALVVTGTRQEIIITEENGCFVVEMVGTTPMPAPTLVHVQEEHEETVDTPTVEDECIIKEVVVEESAPPQGNNLYETLVALRKSLATIEKVPPYLIFHDKTLREMADKMPVIMQDMANISGVGQAKLEKYGPAFLEAISNFCGGA